jgi:hypothetical protein
MIMTIIDVIEQAREMHGLPAELPGADDFPEYSRGQADLIGELFGFSSEQKEDITLVIRGGMSVIRFTVTMLRYGWMNGNPGSQRQQQTTREMNAWLDAHHWDDQPATGTATAPQDRQEKHA